MKQSAMRAILASRMIHSSEQMDTVKSAIDDPVNTELVQQLESYLSDDGKRILKDAYADKERKAESEIKKDADEQISDEIDSEIPDPSGIGRPGIPARFSDRPSMQQDMDTPDLPGDFTEDSENSEETEVESTSKVYGKPVTASSDIPEADVAGKITGLKEFLNMNSSTAGADRIVIKDDEIWIHFNDSINLNNIMLPAIEMMMTPYPWLAFNRLARSENAMVFVINFADQFDRDDAGDDAE